MSASKIEVGKSMPTVCAACGAIPQAGFCKLAGCPTAPAVASDVDDHDYDFGDGEDDWCDRCQGDGVVNCYCGGDLCICENYGEKPCPKCGGYL